jgi:ketosteroid isomerase-like protein
MSGSSVRESNLAVLTAYFDAMAAGGPPATMAYYHPEVVLEVPGSHPAAGRYEGLDGIAAFGAAMRLASGGTFALEPVELLAGDDHVVTLARARVGEASAPITWDRVIVSTVRDGQLDHLRFYESDQALVDSALAPHSG